MREAPLLHPATSARPVSSIAALTQYTTIFPGAIFPRDGIELATLSDGFLLSQTL